jgi:hypothetical protein
MSCGLGRSSAKQTHDLAVVAPPVPATQSLGVVTGVDALLLACSFGDAFFSNPQKFPLAFAYHPTKNGKLPRHVKERARFPADFAGTTKGPQRQFF